ncbi:MAG: hypothetical protein ABJH45_02520 [Paracoccaceae bacterium]
MAWGNREFIEHYYNGAGAAKTLTDIGLLEKVKKVASETAIDRPGGFKDQIRTEVIAVKEGLVNVTFENAYDFGGIVASMGGGALRATFEGTSQNTKDGLIFDGNILVAYTDKFEDPADLIELLFGSSSSKSAPDWLKALAGGGGTPYAVTDTWVEPFSGSL